MAQSGDATSLAGKVNSMDLALVSAVLILDHNLSASY